MKDPRVDIALHDNSGRTPLWWASYWGYYEVIERLIARGRYLGDVKKKGTYSWDGENYTALEIAIARQRKRTEAVSVLERFVANPALTRQEIRKKLDFTGLSLFPFHFHFHFHLFFSFFFRNLT